jgi:hypothetical protein
MTIPTIQVQIVGLRIIATVTEDDVAKDISAATVKKIIFRSPLDSGKVKSATFVTDGTDGKLYYDTVLGDIDHEGTYQVQVYYEKGTFKGYTEPTDAFLANLNLVSSVS